MLSKESDTIWQKIRDNLSSLYQAKEVEWLETELQILVNDSALRLKAADEITERDAALIVYADCIRDGEDNNAPLNQLKKFFTEEKLGNTFSILHLLPFFRWDVDRGFSVENYYEVHPEYGSWTDIVALTREVDLMVDFVANHASVNNPLVQASLLERHLPQKHPRAKEVAEYRNFVIAYSESDKPSDEELATLSRPRANPVLTPYTVVETADEVFAVLGEVSSEKLGKQIKILGQGWVWTTFSRADRPEEPTGTRQVDLNYANPKVLLEALKIVLFYAEQGANIIRLDAVGYIWKKLGSSSLHEPETHLILEVINDVLGLAAPGVINIAEVNEPQEKVFEYLGKKGHEESDLVYQFTHFPLAVHAVATENACYYREWLATLTHAHGKQFITVLGSHDGMGMKPVRGILPTSEVDHLIETLVTKNNALANYASLPGGEKIVYEVCATPWNLINCAYEGESSELQLSRYLAVVALGLIPRGLPAFYFTGLIGAESYMPEGGLDENRTVNREIYTFQNLTSRLENPQGRTRRVVEEICHMLQKRADLPAFRPSCPPPKTIALKNSKVLCALLFAENSKNSLVAIINVSGSKTEISLPNEHLPFSDGIIKDVLSEQNLEYSQKLPLTLELAPYQRSWWVSANA